VIYCVIPRELEGELYEKMVRYYAENRDVTVIVDRRTGGERRRDRRPARTEQRQLRDRRRARIPGTFPLTDLG